jgi:hypothetical protein
VKQVSKNTNIDLSFLVEQSKLNGGTKIIFGDVAYYNGLPVSLDFDPDMKEEQTPAKELTENSINFFDEEEIKPAEEKETISETDFELEGTEELFETFKDAKELEEVQNEVVETEVKKVDLDDSIFESEEESISDKEEETSDSAEVEYGYDDKTDDEEDSEQSKPFKDTYILHEYGVADNAEQILSHYKFLEEDTENTYFVSLSPVFREHQPEDGGWRWHKWGQYIGCQKREGYEYLYDEKNIEYVIVYHVYRIKKVQPFAESENFIYAKVSGNIIQAYTKDTHLNCFTIDFKDREVTTHNTDESRDDTHIQLAKLPEDLNMDNICWDGTIQSHNMLLIQRELFLCEIHQKPLQF